MVDDAHSAGSEKPKKIATVSGAILGTFFDELAKVDDLSDISTNLRKLILTDGNMSEPAILAVLFADAL